jgi:hypothetical protein
MKFFISSKTECASGPMLEPGEEVTGLLEMREAGKRKGGNWR